MPAKMHSFYLRNMYMKNALKDPGGVTLNDVPVDLSKISVPTYFVSAMEDHIAPWKTTYAGPHIVGGKSRFVLSGSGHIAGMINPPVANKYGYWTNDKLEATPEKWLEGARQHEGSWWTNWLQWLEPHLGSRVAARPVGKRNGKKGLRAIEAAPGSYARVRADAR
jgi:polyhydroxyalkanoate synthase